MALTTVQQAMVNPNPSTQTFGFKNRLINGGMVIDQRNAGASVTPTTTSAAVYTLDRWAAWLSVSSKYSVQQNAGSVTPPTGFTNYLGVTSLATTTVNSSDFYYLQQNIEGFNFSDLAWGTASASPITISFWVRSSLTGTFGGALRNSAENRSYAFSYTISVANTWEQKTITIAGDTTGTWVTNSGVGLKVAFSLGMGSTYSGTAGSWASANYGSATGATSVVGTNGATFYITGVQLESGSTATGFDFRSYGTELQLCQRYYEKTFDIGTAPANNLGNSVGEVFFSAPNAGGGFNPNMYFCYSWKVPKRATPTLTVYNCRSSTAGTLSVYASGTRADATPSIEVLTQNQVVGVTTVSAVTLAMGAFAISSEL